MSSIDIEKLQESLRKALGDAVRVSKLPNHDLHRVEVPLYFPDGDPYQIYVEAVGDDHLRLSDKGHLLMQMSYEMDIDLLFRGNRDRIRTQILRETGIGEDDGEFHLVFPISKLSESIFTFGQALTKIYDLLLLNRANTVPGSHDNLWKTVANIASRHKLQKERSVETVHEKSEGSYVKGRKRPSPKHRWDRNNKPKLDDHSEAKHRLLSSYIQKYLSIVCKNPRMDKFNLALVDGFAGGGRYQGDKPGSPLVMIEAVEQARADINENRRKPFQINSDYFFVEQDPDNFASLSRELSGNAASPFLFKGSFNGHLGEIVSGIQKRHPKGGGGAIFFLDQEGYTAVNLSTINYIRNELPQSEIILTFAISNLVDFINDPESLRRMTQNIGLQYLNVDEICSLKEKGVLSNRNIIESKFSEAIFKSTSFRYFVHFFIQPKDNHRGYWLLHLSQHPRAHNAMTETIETIGNYLRHYGGIGTNWRELFFKGGRKEQPLLFGKPYDQMAKEEHTQGLITDLPETVSKMGTTTVKKLIESTCNETAASPELYKLALSELSNANEIAILGKSGGKKRSDNILLTDRVDIERQLRIFLSV